MYSPKVPEELVVRLWRLAQERRVPMTHLVRDAITQYLQTQKGEEHHGEEYEDRGTGEGDAPDA